MRTEKELISKVVKFSWNPWDTWDVSTSTTNVKTSTPNVSRARNVVDFGQSPDVSIIEPPFQAPILVPSDSEDALRISSAESSECALKCNHVQDCKGQTSAICASKCKHIASCFRAQATDCSFRCKHILDCAHKLIDTCALRCKHISDCQCKGVSKCSHVPVCTPGRSVGNCAFHFFHTQDCVRIAKKETCVSECKHTPDCSQATCALKCKHDNNCTHNSASCPMRCSHIPECTPSNVVGICALKCIHTKDCAQTKIKDTCMSQCKHSPGCSQTTCPLKCEHVKDCSHSTASCKLRCSNIPESSPCEAIGTSTLKCIHTQDCVQSKHRNTCVSKCKHTPDCNDATCPINCEHVKDCPNSIVSCTSHTKHVEECSPDKSVGICALTCINIKDCAQAQAKNKDTSKCASKCQYAKDCTQSKSVASCALRCSHVPECTPGKTVGSCTLRCIHSQDCARRQKKKCVSKCKHAPDCTQIVCALKCIHTKDCANTKHSACASKCMHVPECTQSLPIGTCALKCIHVKDCPEAHRKPTSSSKSKCVDIKRSSDDLSTRDDSGGSSSSELGKIKVEPKSVSFDLDIKESVGTSSAADSPSSSCASARAHYYQGKLLATLQVLQNKEETIRVQADSLAVAESRIACLTGRSAELKRELERKVKELQALRKTLEENKVEKIDVSLTAKLKEMENQGNIVSTLQNNLSVIEDLYRECFYETVKQDNLIDMLRKSYLDVRLMDKEKSDQITKLHNVINTQKWTLDKCEDIATEVDNLKMEISNFINASNNDSGCWEESFAGGLNDDLQDIAAQLIKLRDLLTGDCTCGLEDENSRLRQDNDVLEIEIGDLRIRISELEVNLVNLEKSNKRYHEQMECKERELIFIRGQLSSLEHESQELRSNNDKLTCQLTQTQVLLEDKCSDLSKVQQKCEAYEDKIRSMKENLDKTEQFSKENISLRNELCGISRRASRLQRQVQALEEELSCARAHCEHVEACFREKAAAALELEAQLDEAHSRGAALCGEARRVVRAVRGWVRKMKEIHREQEEQIKRKDCEIRCLQQRLEQSQNVLPSRICPSEKTCFSDRSSTGVSLIRERPRCGKVESPSEMAPTCSKRLQRIEGSFASECECVRVGREHSPCTSASEMGSCGSTPLPPKRTLKKKPSACVVKRRYGWWGPFQKQQCEVSVQRPTRCDVATCSADVPRAPCAPRPPCPGAAPHAPGHSRTQGIRPLSPGEEMFSRLESMSAALADGYRRWTRDKRDKR